VTHDLLDNRTIAFAPQIDEREPLHERRKLLAAEYQIPALAERALVLACE
jgi:hypothetical protein